jgi:pimeloyl-ACP methyl ester carboxylesterase
MIIITFPLRLCAVKNIKMKNLAVKVLAFLALDLILSLPAFVSAQVLEDDNGNQISWDGTYYDFRDAEGVQMVKLWIPPNVKPVKGVLIFGHGGSGGDSRYFSRDKNIRDFAQRLGFGIAGLHNFPGREVYEGGERGIGAKAYFKALELFASMGLHPELANAPFAVYGSSNGGAQVYGFVNHAPEKAICFVSNVGSPGSPKIPVNQEWFIPWNELGFDSEPDANALLAFTTGYNDRDEDEHLNPMFNTSGGTNQNSNNIRWIGGGDPYSVPGWEFFRTEGKSLNPPYNWGEIELGAMIK